MVRKGGFLWAAGSRRATEVKQSAVHPLGSARSTAGDPVPRPWLRCVGRGYVALRRLVRQAVIRTPWLDRRASRALARFEGRLPVRRLLEGVSTGQVQCHGMTLHYSPEDMGVVSTILLYGDYEPETTRAVLQLLRPGMCCVDLGAHIGYFSVLAARAVGPSGRVWAFEPVGSTRQMLCFNLAENDVDAIVTVVPRAISDSSGWVRFSIDQEDSVSNKMAMPGELDLTTEEVEATSLDEYFAALDWPEVHLVKMDVEGAELAALRGMDELCRRNSGLALIFEVNPPNLARQELAPERLFEELKERGFDSYRVLHRNGIAFPGCDARQIASLGRGDTVNVLALKGQG